MTRVLFLWLLAIAPAAAQKHEIGLTLGGLAPQARLDGGMALQVNYGRRIWQGARAQWSFETHWLANPQRKTGFRDPNATSDVASMYVTPGLRLTLSPGARLRPWLAFGGGWAWYEQSTLTQSGQPNPAPRNHYTGALQFGGGVDYRLRGPLSLRVELRDFLTGPPEFNSAGRGGLQHNVVAGGGLTFRFGE